MVDIPGMGHGPPVERARHDEARWALEFPAGGSPPDAPYHSPRIGRAHLSREPGAPPCRGALMLGKVRRVCRTREDPFGPGDERRTIQLGDASPTAHDVAWTDSGSPRSRNSAPPRKRRAVPVGEARPTPDEADDARRCMGAVGGHLAGPRDMDQGPTHRTLGLRATRELIDSDDPTTEPAVPGAREASGANVARPIHASVRQQSRATTHRPERDRNVGWAILGPNQ